jgi:hypothetical protein
MEDLYSVATVDGKDYYNLTKSEVLPLISGENETKWVSVTPQSKRCDSDGKYES